MLSLMFTKLHFNRTVSKRYVQINKYNCNLNLKHIFSLLLEGKSAFEILRKIAQCCLSVQ